MQDLKRDLIQLIARAKHRLEETIDEETNPRKLATILKQLAETLRQLQLAEMIESQRQEKETQAIDIERKVYELERGYRSALAQPGATAAEPVGRAEKDDHAQKRTESIPPVVVGKRRGRPRTRRGS